jgi:uncharacterized membrane protein
MEYFDAVGDVAILMFSLGFFKQLNLQVLALEFG